MNLNNRNNRSAVVAICKSGLTLATYGYNNSHYSARHMIRLIKLRASYTLIEVINKRGSARFFANEKSAWGAFGRIKNKIDIEIVKYKRLNIIKQ